MENFVYCCEHPRRAALRKGLLPVRAGRLTLAGITLQGAAVVLALYWLAPVDGV